MIGSSKTRNQVSDFQGRHAQNLTSYTCGAAAISFGTDERTRNAQSSDASNGRALLCPVLLLVRLDELSLPLFVQSPEGDITTYIMIVTHIRGMPWPC